MKSLLVTFDYPPMIGGISNALGTLWERAGSNDSLVLAPAATGDGGLDARRAATTIRFPVVSGSGRIAKAINTISCFGWFVGCAIRHRPEVVIAGQVLRAGLIARLWSLVTRRPFYLWVYGGETNRDFTRSSWMTRLAQRTLRGAGIVFTISPFTTRAVSEFGLPADRVVEIPLGTREDLRPAPKDPDFVSRLDLDDALVFLTVGRLVERKGVDTMLEALAELDGALPSWRYLVVSDGPDRERLERLAESLDLGDKVTFTGYVADEELPVYHNLADVFVMPNRRVVAPDNASLSVEGFGMVFIDAAACGKPVIGGRSGGAVDAISDGVNGFLVEPGDVQDLKRALERLTDKDLRASMGDAGLKLAARFHWARSAEILRPYLDTDAAALRRDDGEAAP